MITRLRECVIEAMLKMGLWPFAPQRVFDEISANGFVDVVRETYTTAGKEYLQPIAQKWVAGVMGALVPPCMVVIDQAGDITQAREMTDKLVREFEVHCETAMALVNFGVTVGRRVN